MSSQRKTKKWYDKQRAKSKELVRLFCTRNGLRIPSFLLTDDEAFVREASTHLTRKDVVIDLGAHVGMAAIQFSHRAGRVYAFEPHPRIFQELAQAANRYPRIIPINAAAAATDGNAQLFSDDDPRPWKHTEGSTLAEGKSNLTYSQSFEVETIDLARFIRELNTRVRMIKMDVEGLEYNLINALLDGDVMDRIDKIHIEDHCDRVTGLADERNRTLRRISDAGLSHKFDFAWP
jgi:FkbM family methyltransferase